MDVISVSQVQRMMMTLILYASTELGSVNKILDL